MNLKMKVLAAAVVAVAITGCSTAKKTETAPVAPSTTQTAPAPTVDTSAADRAAALEAQRLADERARLEREAADRANQLAASLGIRTFYFGFDSSELSSADYNALKAHAAYLSKNTSARVTVAGHADERGTREYNMALGERRAKSVAAFLNSNGVSTAQINTVSFGKEKPAVEGYDEESWAKNRRVELDYTAGKP